jgi:hypothetical protein
VCAVQSVFCVWVEQTVKYVWAVQTVYNFLDRAYCLQCLDGVDLYRFVDSADCV